MNNDIQTIIHLIIEYWYKLQLGTETDLNIFLNDKSFTTKNKSNCTINGAFNKYYSIFTLLNDFDSQFEVICEIDNSNTSLITKDNLFVSNNENISLATKIYNETNLNKNINDVSKLLLMSTDKNTDICEILNEIKEATIAVQNAIYLDLSEAAYNLALVCCTASSTSPCEQKEIEIIVEKDKKEVDISSFYDKISPNQINIFIYLILSYKYLINNRY